MQRRLRWPSISTTQPFFYGYELRWAGYDSDGRIERHVSGTGREVSKVIKVSSWATVIRSLSLSPAVTKSDR